MPVAVVALVLAFAIGTRLAADGGNLTGPVQFGSHFVTATRPPPKALIPSPLGYDGQFFYAQARDPLLLHDATVKGLRAGGAGFRMERVGYPIVAFLLAAGRPGAIPLTLLAANVLVLLALTAGLAVYARRRGWSSLWAVAIALMPGMLLPALRDLGDPLATASMLAGLLLWRSERRRPAALALTIAVLTREVMMLAVAAVAAEAGLRAWRARETRSAARKIVIQAWPVVVLPLFAFAAWQGYITWRYGGLVGGADLNLPLMNLVQEVRGGFHGYPPTAVWDLAYIFLILAAALAALMSLRRHVTIINAGACALALGVLVPTLGDVWSDTRLSAPLFILLLIDGLQQDHRRSVQIAAGAAAMTILVPFAIPATF